MTPIDTTKYMTLLLNWLHHEKWIQEGCGDSQSHELLVPGYDFVAKQSLEAYGYYRHAFVPFFAEAEGFNNLHVDLLKLVKDNNQSNNEGMNKFFSTYSGPKEEFRAQWNNLFDRFFHDGLTHETLGWYQRKYEVELPLKVLAHLCQVKERLEIDEHLTKHRDKRGNLIKGSLIEYVKRVTQHSYPALYLTVSQAYKSKLRNAIGHNSYTLTGGIFRALDGSIVLTKDEFAYTFKALHVLCNSTLWLLSALGDHSELTIFGVLGIGWLPRKGHSTIPTICIFQLQPFFQLDPHLRWLDSVSFKTSATEVFTTLGSSCAPVKGKTSPDLLSILETIKIARQVECVVQPVMPCIHEHEAYHLLNGEYCDSGGPSQHVVPATVDA